MMFRRLQSMQTWNRYFRVENERFGNYYGSTATRNQFRAEARREVDAAMYRMPIRM